MSDTTTKAERARPKRRQRSVTALASGLVVVVAVLVLMVGGFLRGAGHTEDDESGCECPLTEMVAGSIDWSGTGNTPTLHSTAVEGEGIVVRQRFRSDTDPAAAFRSLEATLGETYGPDLETSGVGASRVGELEDPAGHWRLVFQTDRFSGDDLPVTLHVILTVRVPDEHAADVLEELAAVVGRLPG